MNELVPKLPGHFGPVRAKSSVNSLQLLVIEFQQWK